MTALRLNGDGQRLEIQGDMTVRDTPELLTALASYPAVTQVDLHAVDRVDSSALSVLLTLSRSAGGATVTVHHAPPALRALSDLYGLHHLFRVV
jgi:ABC-type transporter Mla MlaB component